MSMEKQQFIHEISEITKMNIIIISENWDTSLFVHPFNLRAEDLYYLYSVLQMKLHLRFNFEKIKAGEFTTLSEIFLSIQ